MPSRQVRNQQHKDGSRNWEKIEKIFLNQCGIAKMPAGCDILSHQPIAGEAQVAPATSRWNSLPKFKEASVEGC